MVADLMRIAVLSFLLPLMGATLVGAEPPQAGVKPAANAADDRRKASWAEWEAEAKMLDGDYDGAVQAEQRAKADRQAVERQESLARNPK